MKGYIFSLLLILTILKTKHNTFSFAVISQPHQSFMNNLYFKPNFRGINYNS